MIKIPVDPDKADQYHYPVNNSQIRGLDGRIKMQIESMALKDSTEKALKDVFSNMLWNWFSDVQENSLSSWQNCLAPIYDFVPGGRINHSQLPTNRWYNVCPNGCVDPKEGCNMCPPNKLDQKEIQQAIKEIHEPINSESAKD